MHQYNLLAIYTALPKPSLRECVDGLEDAHIVTGVRIIMNRKSLKYTPASNSATQAACIKSIVLFSSTSALRFPLLPTLSSTTTTSQLHHQLPPINSHIFKFARNLSPSPSPCPSPYPSSPKSTSASCVRKSPDAYENTPFHNPDKDVSEINPSLLD